MKDPVHPLIALSLWLQQKEIRAFIKCKKACQEPINELGSITTDSGEISKLFAF